MSLRVPNYHMDETPAVKPADFPIDIMLDYDVGELTWENGHLGFHGLGPSLVPDPSNYSIGASGMLESIVEQATRFHNPPPTMDELVPCFNNRSSSPAVDMDALVPEKKSHTAGIDSTRSTRLGSGSDGHPKASRKGVRVEPERSESESQNLTMGTSGFITIPLDDKTISEGKACTKTTTIDDHDTVCHTHNKKEKREKKAGRKLSLLNKRSRDAAIHNKSERSRREKINQRMITLQKLVPNSTRTDKVSILDDIILYMNKVQEQLRKMHHHHKFQPSLVPNPMGLGIGIGMPGMMPNPFVPMTSPSSSNNTPFKSPLIPADPMTAFLAWSQQPTMMEAYSRMAALYHQQIQELLPPSNPK